MSEIMKLFKNDLIYTTLYKWSMIFWSQTYTTWMRRDLQWILWTALKF